MRRIENRGEKAIRARQKAVRCENVEPASWSDAVLKRAAGREANEKAEEMLKPVGELVTGASEIFHADPRETEFDTTRAILYDTLTHPNMISVNASENRMEAALNAGVLEAAVDAAKTVQAGNSLEKMLAH